MALGFWKVFRSRYKRVTRISSFKLSCPWRKLNINDDSRVCARMGVRESVHVLLRTSQANKPKTHPLKSKSSVLVYLPMSQANSVSMVMSILRYPLNPLQSRSWSHIYIYIIQCIRDAEGWNKWKSYGYAKIYIRSHIWQSQWPHCVKYELYSFSIMLRSLVRILFKSWMSAFILCLCR
jgi:hypothetical protein